VTKSALKYMLIIALVACLVPAALADSYEMWLTSISPGQKLGDAYTGPYTGTIKNLDNPSESLVGIPVICNDYNTHSYLGESNKWTVVPTLVSDIPSGNVKFSGGSDYNGNNVDQSSAYAAAAYLALQMMNASDSHTAGVLNYALWDIFTSNVIANSSLSSTDKSAANTAKMLAFNNAGSTTAYSNVTIWTPDPTDASQEFITVNVAEPTAIGILLFNLLAVGVLLVFVRRRNASALS